ncbi:MAG: yycG4 [Cyanobacteria bacterium RYN_339]|nr:yycG4 [Cyanobacteria bacterium RYN_339]
MAKDPTVNVLLVDDRPENLLALEAILEGMGLNLVKANSGMEALRSLLRMDFALILMDVQMPDMNGLETAALIKERQRTRHIPIIFLTAINKEERYVFEGYSVGAVDYLFKPFDPTVLRSKVAVFIELYRKTLALKDQGERLRRAEAREAQLTLEAAQRESAARYRNLAEAMPHIVCTGPPEGPFTYFNQRWWAYSGLVPGTPWNRQTIERVVHEDDVEHYIAQQADVIQTGTGITTEVRLRRVDGVYRWHLAQVYPELGAEGEILGWIGTATDIDDRIRHQEALEKHNKVVEAEVAQRTRELAAQKRFVERLIEDAPAGIAYVDTELVCRSVNPEFARFAGSPAADILDHTMCQVFQNNAMLLEPSIRSVLETGEQFRAIGFPFGTADGADGQTYWDVVYFPVADEDGTPQGVLIFTLEVSDRVENERLQGDQIRHLRQIDTLKDEFLSVISHELRTPLNFIMGFASILQDEVAGPLSPEQHNFLDRILNGTDRMLLLVNDLLDFAKIQAGEFELFPRPTAYAPLVDDVLTTLKPLSDHKRIELQALVPADLEANCDPQRVIQVLTNLVSNAIKFTPEGGIVQVTARLDDNRVITEVEDTGIGISGDNIDKLFMRFRQLDMSRTREVGGTGLGLVIAKALVEAHGGSIGASSNGLGQGATFTFTLPPASAGNPSPVAGRAGSDLLP